jgi:hypothetical protein
MNDDYIVVPIGDQTRQFETSGRWVTCDRVVLCSCGAHIWLLKEADVTLTMESHDLLHRVNLSRRIS